MPSSAPTIAADLGAGGDTQGRSRSGDSLTVRFVHELLEHVVLDLLVDHHPQDDDRRRSNALRQCDGQRR